MSDHIGALERCAGSAPDPSTELTVLEKTGHELIYLSTHDAAYRLADHILDLDELLARIEIVLKAVSGELNRRKEELNTIMIDLDVPYISVRGKKFSPDSKVRYSDPEGAAVEALREHSHPDLGKWSVHWKTLDSTLAEVIKKNGGEPPEWLKGKYTSFEQATVSIKKD